MVGQNSRGSIHRAARRGRQHPSGLLTTKVDPRRGSGRCSPALDLAKGSGGLGDSLPAPAVAVSAMVAIEGILDRAVKRLGVPALTGSQAMWAGRLRGLRFIYDCDSARRS